MDFQLSWFARSTLTVRTWILVTGGSAMLDGLEEMIAQRTQVHTVVANPFANMALSSKIKPRQLTIDAPSLMVACGLAMRRFDPS